MFYQVQLFITSSRNKKKLWNNLFINYRAFTILYMYLIDSNFYLFQNYTKKITHKYTHKRKLWWRTQIYPIYDLILSLEACLLLCTRLHIHFEHEKELQ